jgi:transposase-like protein
MMLKKSTSHKVPPPEVARARLGRPSSYKPEYVNMAKQAAKLGATDADLARIFGVSDATIDNWKAQHPDFLGSLKAGKEEADARVERSLYSRAVGYSFNSEKIFCNKELISARAGNGRHQRLHQQFAARFPVAHPR